MKGPARLMLTSDNLPELETYVNIIRPVLDPDHRLDQLLIVYTWKKFNVGFVCMQVHTFTASTLPTPCNYKHSLPFTPYTLCKYNINVADTAVNKFQNMFSSLASITATEKVMISVKKCSHKTLLSLKEPNISAPSLNMLC